MGVKDRVGWEVQAHPATGAGIRRLVLTWRGARRLLLALGIASVVVVSGWSLAGLDELLTGFTIDTARRQNNALKVQQEALREQAFDLLGRLSAGLERGRSMARLADAPRPAWMGQGPRPPARDAGDEAILAWLDEQGARLEAIGKELKAGRVETGVMQASAPAPPTGATMRERDVAVVQVADMGSVRQQEAAPTTR